MKTQDSKILYHYTSQTGRLGILEDSEILNFAQNPAFVHPGICGKSGLAI